MWSNFFEAGGWGMFPTLIFGVALVVVAALYALRPEPKWKQAVTSLQVMTMGAGLLGFIIGTIKTLRYCQELSGDEFIKTVGMGVSESMNCVALAFILFNCSALLAVVAALRTALKPAA